MDGTFRIENNGRVSGVTILDESIRRLRVKGCLVKQISVIQFPRHTYRNPFTVTKVLNFRP